MIALTEQELVTIRRAMELAIEELELLEQGEDFHDIDSAAIDTLKDAVDIIEACEKYAERHEEVE